MTNTRTDIKELTEAHLQKKVNQSVKEYVESQYKGLWGMADVAHELFIVNQYHKDKIGKMFRGGFCTNLKISDLKEYEKGYKEDSHSYTVTVSRILLVACRDDKQYQELRNSGRHFTPVYMDLQVSKKRMKHILDKADKEKEKLGIREQLEKEAVEGMGNAAELLAEHKETKLKVVPKEEEQKGWTAPQVNPDVQWIQECRKICRQSPELFVRMVKSCVDNGYLSDMSYQSIKEDLKQ